MRSIEETSRSSFGMGGTPPSQVGQDQPHCLVVGSRARQNQAPRHHAEHLGDGVGPGCRGLHDEWRGLRVEWSRRDEAHNLSPYSWRTPSGRPTGSTRLCVDGRTMGDSVATAQAKGRGR